MTEMQQIHVCPGVLGFVGVCSGNFLFHVLALSNFLFFFCPEYFELFSRSWRELFLFWFRLTPGLKSFSCGLYHFDHKFPHGSQWSPEVGLFLYPVPSFSLLPCFWILDFLCTSPTWIPVDFLASPSRCGRSLCFSVILSPVSIPHRWLSLSCLVWGN